MVKQIIIDIPLDDPTQVTIKTTGFKGGECKLVTKPIVEGFGPEVLSDTPTAEAALLPGTIVPNHLNLQG